MHDSDVKWDYSWTRSWWKCKRWSYLSIVCHALIYRIMRLKKYFFWKKNWRNWVCKCFIIDFIMFYLMSIIFRVQSSQSNQQQHNYPPPRMIYSKISLFFISLRHRFSFFSYNYGNFINWEQKWSFKKSQLSYHHVFHRLSTNYENFKYENTSAEFIQSLIYSFPIFLMEALVDRSWNYWFSMDLLFAFECCCWIYQLVTSFRSIADGHPRRKHIGEQIRSGFFAWGIQIIGTAHHHNAYSKRRLQSNICLAGLWNWMMIVCTHKINLYQRL